MNETETRAERIAPSSEMVLYTTADGKVKIDAVFEARIHLADSSKYGGAVRCATPCYYQTSGEHL